MPKGGNRVHTNYIFECCQYQYLVSIGVRGGGGGGQGGFKAEKSGNVMDDSSYIGYILI